MGGVGFPNAFCCRFAGACRRTGILFGDGKSLFEGGRVKDGDALTPNLHDTLLAPGLELLIHGDAAGANHAGEVLLADAKVDLDTGICGDAVLVGEDKKPASKATGDIKDVGVLDGLIGLAQAADQDANNGAARIWIAVEKPPGNRCDAG